MSLEQGVELNWPLTGRKETLGDIGELWAQENRKLIHSQCHQLGTGNA